MIQSDRSLLSMSSNRLPLNSVTASVLCGIYVLNDFIQPYFDILLVWRKLSQS